MPSPQGAYVHKRILITGAAGYIGSGLVAALRDTPCHITRVVRKTAPVFAGVARVTDVVADIREASLWGGLVGSADVIFHLAGQTSVYTASEDAAADFDINVRPLLALLEACRKQQACPAIIFAGTATQCGLPLELPVNESHPDRPITTYDLHKLAAERYLEHFSRESVVHGVTLRLPNIYGPGPASSSPDRGVLNLMIRRALAGQPLPVYGDGRFLRDYLYIDDLVAAFLAAGVQAPRLTGEHFVLGTGQGHTLAQAIHLVADRACHRTGVRVRVNHVDPPPSLSPIESRNFVADASRFSSVAQWKPLVALQEGIDRTISAFSPAATKITPVLEVSAL